MSAVGYYLVAGLVILLTWGMVYLATQAPCVLGTLLVTLTVLLLVEVARRADRR